MRGSREITDGLRDEDLNPMPDPNDRLALGTHAPRRRSRMEHLGSAAAGLAAGLVLVTSGCERHQGKNESRHPSTAARAESGFVNPAVVLHPPPPQPSGPQVGHGDSLLNAAAPKLAAWVAMCRTILPGFKVDSTWSRGRGRWSPGRKDTLQRLPDHLNDGSNIAFDILGLHSPDRRFILDVDAYMTCEPQGDSLEWGGEPESTPVLIDLRTKVATTVEFCGTPCWFDWGVWLSPASFALAGGQEADDFGQWIQGTLQIYSLSDSTVATYVTRIVSTEEYGRYRQAWERWLRARYRSLRASRPRT